MRLFDVYPLYDINIVKGEGCQVWDDKGQEYLDLYGGHAVISIGHCHPHYVQMLQEQLTRLGFYSNSVINRLQEQLLSLSLSMPHLPTFYLRRELSCRHIRRTTGP